MAPFHHSDGWKVFIKLCHQIKTEEEFSLLFDLFLSLEEKETIGKRLLIVQELMKQKLTQREIAQKHHVSISQITRGSNALKMTPASIKEVIKNDLHT
jgi:TrpR family trp operon transcriptional repressor